MPELVSKVLFLDPLEGTKSPSSKIRMPGYARVFWSDGTIQEGPVSLFDHGQSRDVLQIGGCPHFLMKVQKASWHTGSNGR